jgi:hypothetical protein
VTEGYSGDTEARLYTYIPLVEDYFNQRDYSHDRQYLVSTLYPTALDGMDAPGLRLTGMIVGTTSQGGVGGSGSAATVLYIDFTIEIPFHFPLET